MNEEIRDLEKRSVKLDKEKCSPVGLFRCFLLNKIKQQFNIQYLFYKAFVAIYLLVKSKSPLN